MSGICIVEFQTQIMSAACAFAAAIIWWRASRKKAPSELTQAHVEAVHGDIIPILDKLMVAVASQSRLNALAAGFAAVAAILQVALTFMPTYWG